MAYTTGEARDYRDLLVKIVDHVTGSAMGSSKWEILRGQRNSLSRAFFSNSSVVTDKNPLKWDVSVAMGWGDYGEYDASHQLNFPGWRAYLTDLDAHLGVEAETTLRPYSYEVKAEVWLTTEDSSGTMIKDWVVEASNDGSNWDQIDYQADLTWSSGQSRTFNIDQAVSKIYKFWRLRATANNGGSTYYTLGRLRFKDENGETISNAYSPEMILRSSGYSESGDIFVFIRFRENATSDYYNFGHGSFLTYNEELAIESQASYIERYTLLHNQTIRYHLSANIQRFMFVSIVSTVCEFTYLGFFLPYASPAQYPYPFINGGNAKTSSTRYSSVTNYDHSNLQRPIAYNTSSSTSSTMMFPSFTWGNVSGYSGSTVICLSPVYSSLMSSTIYNNDDGSAPVLPYILYGSTKGNNVYGELDGVLWTTGIGAVLEDVCTIGSTDYLVFQNCFQTGSGNYALMIME